MMMIKGSKSPHRWEVSGSIQRGMKSLTRAVEFLLNGKLIEDLQVVML
jgi:hypothetical protein